MEAGQKRNCRARVARTDLTRLHRLMKARPAESLLPAGHR
jgi:hypothetical protein